MTIFTLNGSCFSAVQWLTVDPIETIFLSQNLYWSLLNLYWSLLNLWSSWSYELNLILIEFLQATEKNSINVCFLSKCYLPFAIGSESLFIIEIGTSLVCRLYLMLSSKHSWLKSKEALITDLRKRSNPLWQFCYDHNTIVE